MGQVKINELNVGQLKEKIRSLGGKTTGSKDELIVRLSELVGSENLEDNDQQLNNQYASAHALEELQDKVDKLIDLIKTSYPKPTDIQVSSGQYNEFSSAGASSSQVPQIVTSLSTGITNCITQPPIVTQPLVQNIYTQQTPVQLTSITEQVTQNPALHTQTQETSIFSTPYNPYENTNRNLFTHQSAPSSLQNVRDVIEILPEFDPTVDTSLNAKQFINRVNQLINTYKWNEHIILFAVQAKLKGPARTWNDGQPTVFSSWYTFSNELLRNFPDYESEADIHLDMSHSTRRTNETVIDYFYRMVAKGQRNELSEPAIIKYIRMGLRHSPLQNSIASSNFINVNDFLKTIRRYFENIPNDSLRTYQKINNSINTPNEYQQKQNRRDNIHITKQPICYNCFEPGHLSIKCPKPQRKQRCEICQKSGHGKDQCSQRNNQKGIRRVTVNENIKNVIKDVLINGFPTTALIDSGSECSLVQESIASFLNPETIEIDNRKRLTGFGGSVFNPSSKVVGNIKIDEVDVTTDLLVVEDQMISEPVLLGTDALCSNQARIVIESDKCYAENYEQINVKPGNSLNMNENCKLQRVLRSFSDCLAKNIDQIGKCKNGEMEIRLTTNVPISKRPYRLPYFKRAKVKEITDDLLKRSIIRKSDSAYSSPIVLVKKANGEDRLCIDFRALNAITVKEPCLMPTVDEQLAGLAGNNYFTTLDFMSGYHQIPIKENSKQYTAFVTDDGHYEFNVMPFGLVNAPKEFQKKMKEIINRMRFGEVWNFLDDVIIPSRTIEEGLDRLKRFLQILREEGLTLRTDKCRFLEKEILFLGHRVNKDGIKPGDRKVEAVKDFPQPNTVTEVRRFLGLTGFFRKFVQEYAHISRPLTTLLKTKDVKAFYWGVEQTEAFDKLKTILCSKPVLTLYDPKREHQIHTDASAIGLSGVLLQKDDEKTWKAVAYFSRHCTENEQRFHSHELEVLAIVETLDRFRMYVLGKHFQVITDCAAITTTKQTKPLPSRIARWFLRLQEYDCEMIHRSAQRMLHADALSRAPVDPAKPAEIVENAINRVEISCEDWIQSMQQQDPKLQRIIKALKGEQKDDQINQFKKEFCLNKNRLYRNCETKKNLVVPSSIRWRIVKSCHDDAGHFGVEKTLQRINNNFWFPNARKYVKQYISSCVNCCYNKAVKGKAEGKMYVQEVIPVPFMVIHIDHLGPFPRSKTGNCYVLAIVDRFSKYVVVKAVRSTKTQPVLTALKDLSSYFGLPNQIISDRGTAFTSESFENYCCDNVIRHTKIAVRTPRANGQVERVNQLILNFLKTTVEKPNRWDEEIYKLQWIINTQKNQTTSFSPNEIVFDFPMRELTENKLIQYLQTEEDGLGIPQPINEKRAEAVKRIGEQQKKWKERYDKRHKTPRVYDEGDLVVIEHIASATGESRKLEPSYRGPYVVARSLGKDRYVIHDIEEAPRKQRRFSSIYTTEKMKPWCPLAPELDSEIDDDFGTETVLCQEGPN